VVKRRQLSSHLLLGKHLGLLVLIDVDGGLKGHLDVAVAHNPVVVLDFFQHGLLEVLDAKDGVRVLLLVLKVLHAQHALALHRLQWRLLHGCKLHVSFAIHSSAVDIW